MNSTTAMIPSLAFRIQEKFERLYGAGDTLTVRSPGRVNLIGEHTDYNNGFVLPAAIDKAICMAVSPRADKEVHIVALDLDSSFRGSIDRLERSPLHWPDYLLGVVQQIQALGYELGGFNCVFGGDISP